MKTTDYKTFKKELLGDPEVREEYNKLKPEFEAIRKTLKKEK